jgi:choline-sulfatase
MKPFLTAALILSALLHAAEPRKPNILFILTDDQSPFDFKFHNPDSTLETPVIDGLASGGMIIDAAHHMGSFTGAVCVPSRHMIMSGRTVWHLPIGPGAKHCPPKLEENTVAAVFNRAGYATMRTCKQGNSYPAADKRFSVVHDAKKRGGTAETGSAWHAERVLDYLAERTEKRTRVPYSSSSASLIRTTSATVHPNCSRNTEPPTTRTNPPPRRPTPNSHHYLRTGCPLIHSTTPT